jgi:hypothetical protein
MSGFYAAQSETVDLGGGNTVQIRKLSYAELLASFEDPEYGDKRRGVAEAIGAIVAWDGPGFEDKPASRENFLALPWDVGAKIVAAATKLNFVSEDEGNASGVATS